MSSFFSGDGFIGFLATVFAESVLRACLLLVGYVRPPMVILHTFVLFSNSRMYIQIVHTK